MSLASLLCSLQPLLVAPELHFEQILALLQAHHRLAEYEVARAWAARTLLPIVALKSRSSDPRQRREAAQGIRLLGGRQRAAELLRPLMKDADNTVRARAVHALHALCIDEVALPDTRFRTPRRPGPTALGGWNPTGWSFGLFGPDLARLQSHKAPRVATRKTLLEKYKLPLLQTPSEVATWLGIGSEKGVRRYLRPGSGFGSPYVTFEIPKSNGTARQILAPRAALKRLQRQILSQILAKLPAHDACHGFVSGRSVLTNAAPHQGAQLVLKIDLRDFFPSIHYRRVKGLFARLGYADEVAALLAGLTTHRDKLSDGTVVWPGVLPQGAPTSPALANLLCRRLDFRLSGLAKSCGAVYTRYADDLTFSFRTPPEKGIGGFHWWVDQICQQEGFIENSAKRRLLRPSSQQRITGIVVNSGLSIPRPARRQFRALLHNCRSHGIDSQAGGRKDFRAYLLGFASYVKMVQPPLGAKLLREVRALLSS